MRPRRASNVFTPVLLVLVIIAAACGASPEGDRSQANSHGVGNGSETGLADADVRFVDDAGGSGPPSSLASAATGVIVGHVTAASVVAYSEPLTESAVVAQLTNPTPIGGPLVFQLVDRSMPAGEWVEVYLPIRPNGSTGWIAADQLEYSVNPYRIEIDRAAYELTIYRGSAEWLTAAVAIGTGATPTPVGRFYIIELMRPPDPDSLYGSFAFGLSGFSETLSSFAGGEGVIGVHGTNDPSSIGSDVSHGCVRVTNDVIEAMAGVIPLGTPVVIV